ncbi:hypothetical protein CDAR_96521 [Caerostris darwini]|uniref:Uncharacterized protein n=1 Tax=Caerostris darwini TaxID=1538125 RepID=A0AAV4QUS5_9ARAC|nr:hypothetical protein CDAR_96521 [Caerostris darwini]
MVHFGRCFSGGWTPSPIPAVHAFRRTREGCVSDVQMGGTFFEIFRTNEPPDSEKSDYGISIRGKSGSLIRGEQIIETCLEKVATAGEIGIAATGIPRIRPRSVIAC